MGIPKFILRTVNKYLKGLDGNVHNERSTVRMTLGDARGTRGRLKIVYRKTLFERYGPVTVREKPSPKRLFIY